VSLGMSFLYQVRTEAKLIVQKNKILTKTPLSLRMFSIKIYGKNKNKKVIRKLFVRKQAL